MLPLSDSQLVQRAIAAFQRGDWIEAERLGRAALDANANDSDALQLLGTVAVQTRRPREAAELLGRAATIKPGDAEIHNTRGVALCDFGRFAEAVESYDRAIALVPDYAEAHANRGVALRNLERRDDALRKL